MIDCLVVGAGAAGTVAAGFAARRGCSTLLVESSRDGGRKILISGGGRCNVLPSRLQTDRFVSDSPPTLVKRILRSWPLDRQRQFFDDEIGLDLRREEETGKLFPASNRARDVRDGLLAWAVRSGAVVRYSTRIESVASIDAGWEVTTQSGNTIRARRLLLATGGLSVPKTGSDGFGLGVARRLGHTIVPTYPALTPLLAKGSADGDLAGLSLTATVTARSRRETVRTTDGFLFTHRGYSGPSILDVSHVVTRADVVDQARVSVRWTSIGEEEWRPILTADGARPIGSLLREHLPSRLAERQLHRAGVAEDATTSLLDRSGRERLIRALVDDTLPVTGDEGYKKAEVTGGGVSLEEVDRRTMRSRRVAHLFFCGEILDAFGPIGGYNFLWAWATGRAAGEGIAAEIATTDPGSA